MENDGRRRRSESADRCLAATGEPVAEERDRVLPLLDEVRVPGGVRVTGKLVAAAAAPPHINTHQQRNGATNFTDFLFVFTRC
jgi:hypothetical protein